MIVYRLSGQAFINDLSGYGAEKTGGRWNSKGIPVLYTAASRALAVVEIAVHVPLGIIPTNYFIAAIDIPENDIVKTGISDLPANWNRNPFIKATQLIGDEFIKNNKHLVLQVPSASVSGDFNYLINPRHSDFNKVKLKSIDPFVFDARLFRK
ncbi:RES family NAD+ phosphorylase [Mucilaginibacter sp. UR6-11]|uniref:RES family NAD+ phosphorylase n=1 Tax=Mucilaginibacter sp. UR6-11 TaxID=1435644 RepID=UPI001E567A03|nr:RES family NAD+ phosphorylase [Mucilaginibacter sp. UR6-11]MCC8425198.1 RES family NAD+ phosphorylase [Mucilaginibacter sp. UR6-11]